MKKALLIFASLLVAFFTGLAFRPHRVLAARPVPDPQIVMRSNCTVPKSWGALRTSGDNLLFFEDSNGTIRWLNIKVNPNGGSCDLVVRQ